MRLTEEFLKFCHRDIPEEKIEELKISYDCLQEAFLVVCDTSSKQAKQIVCAVDLEMVCFKHLFYLGFLQGNLVKKKEFDFALFCCILM